MGVSGQRHAPGRALPPGKGPPVPIVQEAGWAPEPIWTQGLEEKSSASVGDRTPVVQPVVRHYTDWDTAGLTEKLVHYTSAFLIFGSTPAFEIPPLNAKTTIRKFIKNVAQVKCLSDKLLITKR
jgi:hypothetical protein